MRDTSWFDLFIAAHSRYAGKSAMQVRAELGPDECKSRIRTLHEQYMAGQFSFGRFTELVGVAHLELREILALMSLPTHN